MNAFRVVARSEPSGAEAALYADAAEKGPPAGGYRLTLLTPTPSVRVNEVVRVVHVCESVAEEAELYVMGPKPILGEYVDGVPATGSPAPGDDPFAPASYDGRVLPGPGVDTNYEVTEYAFLSPGEHTIQWRLGANVSNTLRITVR